MTSAALGASATAVGASFGTTRKTWIVGTNVCSSPSAEAVIGEGNGAVDNKPTKVCVEAGLKETSP